MKVQGLGGAPTVHSVEQAKINGQTSKGASSKQNTETVSSSFGGADVRVSRQALELSASKPVMDPARVDRLRGALSSNTAKVDSVAIAQKLAEEN